ncbi:MAG: cell division protein ZapE [Alphaproteobacteria bacterium]|nr:cell division protein ZapE [Alphaproteobacteria bacterium]
MSRVKQIYDARLAAGQLLPDPAQAEAVALLDALARSLPRAGRWFAPGRRAAARGLYIWGSVGRGKSMLMDLFFEAIPTRKKRRIHFHDFMIETHTFIFEWRKLTPGERRRHPAHVPEAEDDPIAPAARNIANSASVLGFDEFHVTSIADAMILGRLFEQLFDRNVVIVATSNRKPADLYENGVNRQLFMPFVRRFEAELDVIELKAARDYRLDRLSAAPVYYAPLGPGADTLMNEAFARLTAGAPVSHDMLEVQGRTLRVRIISAGVARFSFDELCARPLGAADYLALARRYHTVFLDNVPAMTFEHRNWAARFVTLIDALYESKTKLVMSAAAGPDDLYPAGDGAFEFARTASRLHEMRSAGYLAAERQAEPAV